MLALVNIAQSSGMHRVMVGFLVGRVMGPCPKPQLKTGSRRTSTGKGTDLGKTAIMNQHVLWGNLVII
jgi:hypothetical protein